MLRKIPESMAVEIAPPPTIAEIKSEKEKDLRALAMELGYSLTPMDFVGKSIAKAIAQHLCNRKGNTVEQTASFFVSMIELTTAETFLGASFLSDAKVPCWKAGTVTEVASMMRPLLAMLKASSDFSCAGASRGLKTESEVVIRVVATLMPTLEIDHLKGGGLRFQFQYILFDETGELHAPKDEERREIELEESLEVEMRKQVFSDLSKMGSLGYPLSAGFWRQLQREEKALVVEALSASRARARTEAAATGRKRSRRADVFEVEEIRAQRGNQCLVRWAGYHPSWEPWRVTGAVGDPVETWEAVATVRRTQAMLEWKGAAE